MASLALSCWAAVLCACAAASAVELVAVQSGGCNPSGARVDCGHVGTDQQQCLASGCCWSPVDSSAGDTPWCFHQNTPSPPPPPSPPAPTPPAPAPSPPPPRPTGPCDPNNRTDCKIGDQQGCEHAGCCWSPVLSGATRGANDGPADGIPWCFFHSPPSPACHSTPTCSGHGSCTNGTCVCTGGYATCGSPSLLDCSVNVATDASNCGSCGHACASGPGVQSSKCVASKCAVACDPGYLLCFDACYKTDSCAKVGPYSEPEMKTIIGYFLDNININGTGGVAASPSLSNPDYYFHWMRDGALSMDTAQHIPNTTFPIDVDKLLASYIAWVHSAQQKPDANCDVRGEPKFLLSPVAKAGTPYPGGWMRPQNDGPALRTLTIINYGTRRFNQGDKAFAQTLFPSLALDLAYIEQQWDQPSGDPWEEVKGDIFFTKMVQHRALVSASAFATLIGNPGASANYSAAAKAMEASILAHWSTNSTWGPIFEELPGQRPLDCAVHLGIIYASGTPAFIPVTDDKAQSSLASYVKAFGGAYFPINAADDKAGLPGVLTGRYPDDHYQGSNPWILCTNAVGRFYYEAATGHAADGAVRVTKLNLAFFREVLDEAARVPSLHAETPETLAALRSALQPGTTLLHAEDPALFRSLMQLLVGRGDGQLLRVKHHIQGNSLHMPEQLSGSDGSSVSAVDLTWSYATAIAAMTSRAAALRQLQRL